MKKFLALFLTMMMTVAVFSGCTSTPAGESGTSSSDSRNTQTTTSNETNDITIGINFYSITDALGSAVYDNLNYIADQIDGVKNQWLVISAYDETAQISDCENLISAGVDGLVFMPISDNVAGKVADLCEENGVYCILTMRNITDEEILARVSGYKYFLGWCTEDCEGSAYALFQTAVADGRTKAGTIYFDENAVLSAINIGYRKGFAEGKIESAAEYTIAGTTDDLPGTVTNFLTLYPDIDCILTAMASNGSGEGIMNVLYSDVNRNDAKLYCFDSFEGMADGFDEGKLGGVATGHFVDPIYSYMILLNALQGNRLSEEPVKIGCNYVILTNSEELKLYETYIDNRTNGFMVYNGEELKNMLVSNNPGFTLEELRKIASSYTMEQIKEKVASFLAS